MPVIELRRLRRKKVIRDWVSRTELHPRNFILPYFVVGGEAVKEPIESMEGVYRLSIDNLLKDIREAYRLGIRSILLFGVTETRDESGSEAYRENGLVQRAIREIKQEFSEERGMDLIVITDVCLCGYTSHGHCGVVEKQKTEGRGQKTEDGSQRSASVICHPSSVFCPPSSVRIDNNATLPLLARIALSHAEAGADFVAPSAMMDGQVGAIRKTLDSNGWNHVGILAYSAKYASNFYGPFREALGSAPRFGDRKSYQMDFRNPDEALREIAADIEEGADIVMVKPALAYLDIIHRARNAFRVPLAAYNVSGEYSLVKELSRGDPEREQALGLEILTAIKRAGADIIITYYAKEAARWLSRE
ncbi:MAG TPA: porphobilinogen synthase [Proteobacteria bacterium]|nr:porphobilinogen synthase [Pseudomonadota bacterium]